MQVNSHGIPCNVPYGYRPNPKVKTVKRKQLIAKAQYKHFVELTRYVDGLEETVHVPVNTKAHKQALQDGYAVVREWMVN